MLLSIEWRRARDLNPRDHFRSLHDFQSCSFGQLGQLSMAPQVGFEPTTDRLTADCSTTELLWNMVTNVFFLLNRAISGRALKVILLMGLAASYSCGDKVSTTISAEELNFCVRYGNRCDLFAIATRPINFIYNVY